MPTPPRLKSLTLLALGLALGWLSASAQPIRSPAEWDAKINHSFHGVPVVVQQWVPDDDSYAWQGARFIEGYLSMARLTGEPRYMDDARRILDHMLSNRDDIRFADKPLDATYYYAPTYYLYHRGTPAKGWRRKEGPKDSEGRPAMGVSTLIDGRICEMFIHWCELARQGFPGRYEADIQRYLDRIHETIEMHQPAFHPITKVDPVKTRYHATLPAGGFRLWWHVRDLVPPPVDTPRFYSGQLPLNHSVTMARAMLGYDRLRGAPEYREKARLVVNFFLNSLDLSQPDLAIWEYDPARADRFDIEDFGHASIDLPLIQTVYEEGGFGIDDALVARLVKTFHRAYDDATKDVYFMICGPRTPDERPRQHYGDRSSVAAASWLWLAQFDPSIAVKARATYETHLGGAGSGFVMGGWANLLYTEALLAGKVAIPPAKPGSAVPKPGGS